MPRFSKIYLEITNCCNLQCSFCPGTGRTPAFMAREQFTFLLPRLRPFTDYLYFHLMGEPLCHPLLADFLDLAGQAGFRVILTTNGTLLKSRQEQLLSSPALHKVNVSLHSFEGNNTPLSFSRYLDDCLSFGKAAEGKVVVSYRLWNVGGADALNGDILRTMEGYFPPPWREERLGPRIGHRVYLQYGDRFDWPDLTAPDGGSRVSCYGLRDQLGVLCDGTVVPCCLDHEGDIPLGNLFEQALEEILSSPRAQTIINGFSRGCAAEELCRKCGYARSRFQ